MTDYSPETVEYLSQFDPELLGTSEGRRILTRLEPRLFSIIYLTKHVTNQDGRIVFAPFHLDWYEDMLAWIKPAIKEAEWRRCYVAPRKAAKTTTWFLIAPMWAAAHGHSKFIVAIADSEGMATEHLKTFKDELENNELLRLDFPELCAPGSTYMTTDIQMKNGFIFKARGITGGMAGMKVGALRPDVVICDDIEPLGADYSLSGVKNRLNLLQQKVLGLNETARMVIAGTVSIDGSIIHQLAKTAYSRETPEDWITAAQIKTRYIPCIVRLENGTEASVWSEQYSWDWIERNRKTAVFQINYQNVPLSGSGTFWSQDDIRIRSESSYIQTVICVDPAAKSKKKSDFTSVSVVSYNPMSKIVTLRDIFRFRKTPDGTNAELDRIASMYPEAKALVVETNQGGDYLQASFADVVAKHSLKYVPIHSSKAKEERARWLLYGYQTQRMFHAREFPSLDAELLAFPDGVNDDQVDAVGFGYVFFVGAGIPDQNSSVSVKQFQYT